MNAVGLMDESCTRVGRLVRRIDIRSRDARLNDIYIARFTLGHEEEEAWSAGKNGRQLVATVIRFDTCYAWYEGMEFFFFPQKFRSIEYSRCYDGARILSNEYLTFVSN